MRLQEAQNECIRFCLKLNTRSSIKNKSVGFRFMKEYHDVLYAIYTNYLLRIVLTILMRYVPLEINGVHTRSSNQKLSVPHRKTNVGQNSLEFGTI